MLVARRVRWFHLAAAPLALLLRCGCGGGAPAPRRARPAIEGNAVTGTLIGGPTLFFSNNYSTTYRADITKLNLVVPGANVLQVKGGTFDQITNGASIIAVIDDGTTQTHIQLLDGQDLAFINFPAPRNTTVPQVFNFTPRPYDRQATITVFAGSVEGPVSGADPIRPNIIRVITGGVVTDQVDFLASKNGDEWDHGSFVVTVPANAGTLSIQALSASDGTSNLPASFNWIGAALQLPEPSCGDGLINAAQRTRRSMIHRNRMPPKLVKIH